MGFSNYFIFYFIRRFLNIIFNKRRLKKFAFIIIFAIIILFILHNKGYCVDWSYTDSSNLSSCKSYLTSIYSSVSSTNTYLSSIYSNTSATNTNLSTIANKLDLAYSQNTLIRGELDDIELYLQSIDTSNDLIYDEVSSLTTDISQIRAILDVQMPLITQLLNTINTSIANESDDIQSTLNSESQEIQDEISQDFSDLQELLTQYMFGSNYDNQTYNLIRTNSALLRSSLGNSTFRSSTGTGFTPQSYYFELPHSDTKTFNFKVTFNTSTGTGTPPSGIGCRVGFSNTPPIVDNPYFGAYSQGFAENTTFTYSFNSSNYNDYKYLVISCDSSTSVSFTGDYNEVMEKGSTQSIMDNQSENAEMIDNTITDSNVNAPFGDLPTDSTQDITESGFTNIFDTIRTTFTSGVARDLVVPIPFTGKSFTINTANVYGNINLGMVGTLITAFWYFAFSLFIAKDIAKKINMIKSGNLENIQSTNIKEDLL